MADLMNPRQVSVARNASAPWVEEERVVDEFPLTYGQRALWFLERLSPANSAYVIAGAARIHGRAEPAALRRAALLLAARHPALRTTFHETEDGPLQRVGDAPAVDFVEADAPDGGDAELPDLLSTLAFRPFDLAHGPLWRVVLMQAPGGGQALAISIHHIVSDFWSLAIMVRELGVLYGLELGLPMEPLPPPGATFAQVVRQEQELLAGEEGERLWEHWRQALSGVPFALELPADRPRPAVQSYAGAGLPWRLPAATVDRLKRLSRGHGATLYMTLLAGFETLLERSTGEERMIVGCPTTGRGAAASAGLVGYLVNAVPIVGDVTGDPDFLSLLERARTAALRAFAHRNYPLALLVERLGVLRDASRSPIFQVSLVFQRGRRAEEQGIAALAVGEAGVRLAMGPLALESLALSEPGAQFDLTLILGESGSGDLVGRLQYSRDLFEPATVARLGGHLAALLDAAGADACRRLTELPLLTAAEQAELTAWNATAVRYPGGDLTLPELLARQVAATPDTVAVVAAAEALTYAGLAARVDRFAGRLQGLGVGPETVVGLCAERSLDMVLGLLAILGAGGAYLPLAPTDPIERLAAQLADARVPILLVQEHLIGRFPTFGGRVALLDEPLWSGVGAAPAGAGLTADHLAYVIFTSGSTGRPKGVMNRHRGIVNRLLWAQAELGLSTADRVLQKTSYSFDVSVWELFWPLLSGACLVLARPGGQQDSAYLVRTIAGEAITVAHFVPSMLGAFLAEPDIERCAALRRVMASGEALAPDLARRLLARLEQVELYNLYGPTEAAVEVTFWACERQPQRPGMPIGRPIGNTRIHLLDRVGNEVPVGVAGELAIGGVQVARGYVGRPEGTAERFVPDPFAAAAAESGMRLYRTGDLARRRPTGEIEYLGRLDHQIKLRGFRVELGEIESVLTGHPGLRAAVVTAALQSGQPGDLRLVAHVVSRTGAAPAASALRQYLAERLPAHMVPALFVPLESLPLTTSGKVDRRALPAPVWTRESRAPGEAQGRARGPLEEIVALIWTEVLGLPEGAPVDSGDSFFDLGGHSLLATQVVSRIRRSFGVELPVRTLFEASTLGGLAARLEAALEIPAAASLPPIAPVTREGPLRLSFAQERLWFLDQLAPGSTSYNMAGAVRLSGRLVVTALQSAFAGLVERHEILRTTFKAEAEGPVLAIAAPRLPRLPLVDISALPSGLAEETARQLGAEEAARPFDLQRGPLLRTALLRLGSTCHIVLLTLHHTVADGWSLGVLQRELAAFYAAALDGRPAPLPALPVQYADFAAWQRGWLSGGTLERQLGWWRDRLATAPTLLELPVDRPRPAVFSPRGSALPVVIPAATAAGLGALARSLGATPFMTLFAGFSLVLSRWTGQQDLLVGSPVAGRTYREIEDLIGFFANTLVLRAELAGRPSFGELIGRVREMTLGAFAHQDLPFERLVEELQPQRDLSRSPLFQALLALQNQPAGRFELPGLTLEPVTVETAQVQFELQLSLGETADGLAGTLSYAAAPFDRVTIERFAGHLVTLLAGAVARPDLSLGELPLLTSAERAELAAWNATATSYAESEWTLPMLLERQAAATPDAVALVASSEHLTYGALAVRARRLASRLCELGVGPETAVGLCAERSLDLGIALWAILAAGGAYLPLDPGYPAARLAALLTDAAAPVVLVQERFRDRLPEPAAQVVVLDASLRTAGEPPPSAAPVPDNLAYVIFTSGSTGRPKGVMNSHRGIVNRLLWGQSEYGLSAADRVLHKTPFTFDVSVWELFWPLTTGACLVLARPGGHRDSAYLMRTIAGEQITVAHFVPSMLAAFVAEPEIERCSALQRVLASGEALSPDLAQQLLARLEQVELHNLYGPTEAAVEVTFWACLRAPAAPGIPIGRPVANTQIRLLDREGCEVPVGVAGELAIGGVQVARGYVGRPDLTAERFVPDAFTASGRRLYRTGDLARRRPGGEIEYLGRLDDQVKVRGFRIEPGEIESILRSHPQIEAAAVLAPEVRPGDRRLVAYVTGGAGQVPAGAVLAAYLGERLPEHMVPTLFVPLESLPLTASGKIDRRALPVPSWGGERQGERARLRTPVEEIMAAIWSDVLGLGEEERPGVDDNFFALGGHSLLATRLVSRLRQSFGVELPLKAVFEAPTIAALAARVERAEGGPAPKLPPLAARHRTGELPLSFAQERLWILDQLEPGRAAYNIAGAVRLTGDLSLPALAAAFGAIVGRHESLRTTFQAAGKGPVQVIAPGGPFPLPLVDLEGLPPAQRDEVAGRLAQAEAASPFDLLRGPLLRGVLLRLARSCHLVLLTMHHIVSDGWSMAVFVRELTVFYAAALAGRPAALPPLAAQYADFASWQRGWLAGEELARQLSWWRDHLAGAPALLELPTDRPRPAVRRFRGGAVPVTLPAELAGQLAGLGRESQATLFMTLLAGFAALLGRFASSLDLVVGSPVANRRWAEVEGLIGFFVNTLALRTVLPEGPGMRDLLGRVRKVTLEAYAHQDLPFEKLIEELAPRRSLSHSPLFQVVLALQNAPPAALELPGLLLERLPAVEGVAKFDLYLDLTPDPSAGAGITGTLEYDRDLFDRTTALRLKDGFVRLLAAAVAAPERELGDLPLLSPAERQQLLEWREEASVAPRETTVPALFSLDELGEIGQPLADREVSVLGAKGELVPLGAAGELVVGGDGLARGYWRRPDLTADRFRPDPLSRRAGARVYHTGDRARWRPDARLELLGRLDRQVRLHGLRIEVLQIESALTAHPEVAQAVVTVREDHPGEPRLVAHVVGGTGAELRAYLRERLPEYMVPSAFVRLAALPLSSDGEVDRAALPAPEEPSEESGGPSAPTPTEERMRELWSEVLSVEGPAIGRDDSFFAFGGNSLLATLLAVRVQESFGVDLPVRTVFEAPKLADLASVVERALAAGAGLAAPPVAPVPRTAPPRLSFAQERAWFLDQLAPGSASYNVASTVRLSGQLSIAALEAAFAALFERHEALRTTFRSGEDGPIQWIAPPGGRHPPLPLVDLACLPGPAREIAAGRLAVEEAARAFDLVRGPLLRSMVFRLGPELHLAVVNFHHIVADGWSLGVFVRELAAFYEAALDGRPALLPDLPVQYADFAVWQRGWLAGEVLNSQLGWWRERLAGAPMVLDLPTDRPRPAVLSSRGRALPIAIPMATVAGLNALAQYLGATLFMTLFAGFAALLGRWTGQEDLLIGSPVAGRTRRELEGLIGFFANTLVLRAELAERPSFGELIGRVREMTLGAYAHQDLPFERLVEELHPARDLSRSPLFQAFFVLQNQPGSPFVLPGLTLEPALLDAGVIQFELHLSLVETADGLEGTLAYAAALFDRTTIERLVGHLARLLAGAVDAPAAGLGELPLLGPAEIQQLREWNATDVLYPAGERCLHELVQEQARLRPAATAVRCGSAVLSYGELDRRSDALARQLGRLGVGPEVCVAIAAERSLELIIGLLGILKAGGAYLPLDVTHPADRLAHMLADSQTRVLLVQPHLSRSLPATDLPVVALAPQPGPADSGPHSWRTPTGVGSANLAYVIYTSGSTGRPKGVMNTHRGIVNRLLWGQERYGLRPADRVLQKTPVTFDVSVWELFWPLLTGAELVMARPGGHQDPAYLVERIAALEITTAHFVPSMLRAFLETPGVARCRSLVRVFASGEALPRDLERRYFAELAAPLYNLYGPTEAAVEVTHWTCAPAERRSGVPIGRPAANTRIHLLDRELRPLAIGATGELYIGGVQVARGYRAQPELTAERFVPDPVGGEAGARLYRSGDLARWLPDGTVDFLGRADHQVKVRGFRIELGEIEAVLLAQPEVGAAVVMAREAQPGDLRLVAYVVAQATAAELRAALLRRLPEYMVPAAFVLLPTLPLLPNGKVDRAALPAPGESGEEGYVAPRDPVQGVLAGIWEEVLGRERVGAEAHFFALGGHSLLATRVVSRVRQAFGVELPVRRLFERPTLAELAAAIGAAMEESGEAVPAPPILPLPPGARAAALPLSFAQQRLWFLDQWEPGSPVYNMPVALRASGRLSVPLLAAALTGVANRHESLRTTFEGVDGEPAQRVHSPGPFPLPAVDLSALPAARAEAEGRRLAGVEARRGFDLVRGPVFRVTLLRLAPAEHVLLATLHHIVSDGWSMDLLTREIAELYRAGAEGRPADLPVLPVQYADFAAWQRRRLAGEALAAELTYWRHRLDGAPAVLDLPADRPRPAFRTSRGAVWRAPLTGGGELAGLARREGATLFMVLLAAFQVLLGRHADREDVSVGTPIAGRTHRETEELIGFFVNTLVLRADLAGDPPFRRFLGQVRETLLQAHAHQDLPFEKLVEELAPERNPSHPPLFQVMFSFLGAPPAPLELPGVRLSALPAKGSAAKFDLSFGVEERTDGLFAAVTYSRDLFDAATVGRLVARFARLLADVAVEDRRLSALPLLATEEQAQIVREWNDTAAPFPADRCLHELFAARAASCPGAVAVTAEEGSLSYGELEIRGNRLAHRLRSLGAGPEVAVAVCCERSLDMVIALLGALKAGSPYVPLDPDYPADRLAFMLADSGAPLLLAQERLLPRLPGGARVVVLDRDRGELASLPATPPAVPVDPASVAYVIYTSGSTGRPKGVMVPHRSVVNRLLWAEREYPLDAADRVLQKASFSFDFSVWECFGPLLAGARVVLARPGGHREPDYLARLLAEQEITLVHFVPSLLQAFLAQEEVGPYPALRAVMTGGEALPAELRQLLFDRLAVPLRNQYGPTELAIDVTHFLARPGDPPRRSVPIGRAIANSSALVLDRSLGPQPIGVPGELFGGGAGVARGYLGRPDLTAERFVPDPFAAAPGGRLYRTGDLVRSLPDGHLEFLGRSDHQVKIRGFRIELGEIESALLAHPAVREAAVVARRHRTAGDLRLVAYGVAKERAEPAELRDFLARTLPAFMVPDAFVLLDRLPLTPSGKLDRAALPAPDWEGSAERAAAAAPETPVEEIVAAIWCELLGLERVGRRDSFFALGGHSLLATRLVSRLRRAFGVELPLRQVFEAPTLAEQARAVEAARREGAGAAIPPLLPLSPEARQADLPLSFAQQRLWFVDQLDLGNPAYNIPLFLRLVGPLSVPGLWAAQAAILRRHEALRSRFPAVRGVPVQEITDEVPGGRLLVDHSALASTAATAELARLQRGEQGHRFSLERGPLLRALLVRRGSEDHAVLLTMHHIAFDGWSLAILSRELEALYTAALEQRPATLPQLPVQYGDYAAWQRRELSGRALERLLAYWTGKLAALPPPLALPYDRPRLDQPGFRGAALPVALSPEVARSARELARREGATLFVVLLAGFKVFLAAITGQHDLLVGSPVAGRTRTELEPLIGMFMNTLVLRTDLAGDPTFAEIVRQVRTTALEAYDHQDLPFERLVDAVLPAREAGRPPLSQVWFVLQNQEAPRFNLPRLHAEPLPLAPAFTKFDLALNLSEEPTGISGQLEYPTELFDEATARHLASALATLLARALADPELHLAELAGATATAFQAALAERRRDFRRSLRSSLMNVRRQPSAGFQESGKGEAGMKGSEIQKPSFKGLGAVDRRLVSVPRDNLVSLGPLLPDAAIPQVIRPAVEGVDVAGWVNDHRDLVAGWFRTHRALLFRGFDIGSVPAFHALVQATSEGELLQYKDRSTPRHEVGKGIYVSTIYPAAQSINMHNEGTYWRRFPKKLYFCALQVAEEGGETPIADVRKVLARLDPEVRERFRAKGVLYVRNYNDGLGLPWQEVFQSDSREEVEAYCRSNFITFEWKDNGRLRTRQVRPAVRLHPDTGEEVWFNHGAFFHVSSLERSVRDALLADFGEEGLPYNTYYGDGTPIPPEVALEIQDAYRAERVVFPWQVGDVLLLDNLSVAHGRQPYVGERQVVVAMTEPQGDE